jgi:hypothetical protein
MFRCIYKATDKNIRYERHEYIRKCVEEIGVTLFNPSALGSVQWTVVNIFKDITNLKPPPELAAVRINNNFVIITIIIIINQQSGLNRPVSGSSNSLFKMPSSVRSIIQQHFCHPVAVHSCYIEQPT